MSGGVIILAAGYARRFGSDKRRYRLASGETLLQATFTRYRNVFDNVAVVMREEDRDLAAELGAPEVVIAHDARLGMGHSLASGVAANSSWDYLFIALGDMPYVREDTLAGLRGKIESDSIHVDAIVQPSHLGQPGHPVGFTPTHYPALMRLQGDSGAKSVLANVRNDILELVVDDEGVLRDLDQPLEKD